MHIDRDLIDRLTAASSETKKALDECLLAEARANEEAARRQAADGQIHAGSGRDYYPCQVQKNRYNVLQQAIAAASRGEPLPPGVEPEFGKLQQQSTESKPSSTASEPSAHNAADDQKGANQGELQAIRDTVKGLREAAVPDVIREFDSAARMTSDFVFGDGPETRDFGPDSPETRALSHSSMTRRALDFWYAKNAGASAGSPLVLVDDCPGGFGLPGLIDAGQDPIEQFVGNAKYSITPDPSRDLLLIRAENNTSETSASYKMLPSHDRSTSRAFGNMYQNYTWEEPIDWGRLAAPQPMPRPTPPRPTPTPEEGE